VRQPELVDAAPLPAFPRRIGVRRRRGRIAFEHGDLVPVAGHEHRRAQATKAGAED
jgi:hypothetical protein